MLSSHTEAQLFRLLSTLIQREKSVEIQRKILAEDYTFSPIDAFERLGTFGRSSLIPQCFNAFLEDTEANEGDCYLLVRQYSSGDNGRLSYDDFLKLILPRTDLFLNDCASRRYSRGLNQSQEWSLKRVIEREVELQKNLEKAKRELSQSEDFSVWQAFKSLDLYGIGHLTRESLYELSRKFGQYWFDDDIDALLSRVARNHYEVIEYNEFLDFILPIFQQDPSKQNEEAREEAQEEVREEPQEEVREEPQEEESAGKSEEEAENPQTPQSRSSEESQETPLKKEARHGREVSAKSLFGGPSEEMKEVLRQQVKAEMEIEGLRRWLSVQLNCSIDAIQAFFNWPAEIYINDLEQALTQLGIRHERENIDVLFSRYGRQEGLAWKLNKEGLESMLFSGDQAYVAKFCNRDVQALNEETEEILKTLLTALVQVEDDLNPLRSNVTNVEDQFNAFDKDQDGEISLEELRDALKEAGLDVTNNELQAVFQRYAHRGKGSLKLRAFQQELERIDEIPF